MLNMKKTIRCYPVLLACLLAAPAAMSQSIWEEFDNVPPLFSAGWYQQNNSLPLGPGTWRQDYGNFQAHSGLDSNSSIVCSYESTDPEGSGDISNWLLTPEITMNDGDTLRFYTRSYRNNVYPDRMEVRMSVSGGSTDVGTSTTSIGVFDSLLLVINQNLETGGAYPMQWYEYIIPIDVPAPNTQGRIAFRYYVTDGGGNGTNSSVVGIDDFKYLSVLNVGVEEPESVLVIYPNPADTKVKVVSSEASINRLEVIHPTGMVQTLQVNTSQYDLEVRGWAKGIYLLKVYWEGHEKPSLHKVIIQ